MNYLKRLFAFLIAVSAMLSVFIRPVIAEEPAEDDEDVIESIIANTSVSDSERAAESFEITVKDAAVLEGLTAEDFDILNNGTNLIGTPEGEIGVRYEDDGIELSVEGNVLTMTVKPFRYPGIYEPDFSVTPWEVKCLKNDALSFTANDVTELKTRTLDDAVRGEFTYAGLTRKYALYVPKNEDGTAKKNLPLVIWNHGGGEYNIDIEQTLVANRGLTAWNEEGYECAVLVFQIANPNYSYMAAMDEAKKSLIDQNNALQAAFVRQLIADGTVNKNRVYVTGASSGGGATMRFLLQYPEMFAGAIAMCSMDPIVWVHYNRQDSYETIVSNFEAAWKGQVYTWDEEAGEMVAKDVNTEALLNVPIAFTHAEADGTCSINSSRAMYESMANLGDTNNITRYYSTDDMKAAGISNIAGGGLYHWSWVPVFNNSEEPEPMWWLFQQDKTVIESITANTSVSDSQRAAESFEITVKDAAVLEGLTAEDFDILNNGTNLIGTPEGEIGVRYEDDGIELSVEGNVLTMTVKPFRYPGIYEPDFSVTPWEVRCLKNDALSFTANDVTELKTRTLDDAVRGEFTYAGLTRKYALYVPKNEDGTAKKNLPLVIWNHGGGEYNIDIEETLVANRGLTAWNEEGYECAVLVFQIANPNYSYMAAMDEAKKSLIDQNNALQAAFVRELIADGTVDADRVYVTGASSGGGATMRFLLQYPEMFAGAIAMCSMDPIVWVHYNRQDSYETIVSNFEAAWKGQVYTWDEEAGEMVAKDVNTEALLNVPIAFTHAEADGTCSINSSRAMYESMANLGDTNNITRYYSTDDMKAAGISNIAGGGLYHWSWVPVFNNSEEPEPMWWLFQQKQTSFTVEPAEAEMPTNSTLQLTASQDAVWTSSDESVATVDENGKVTALRYGKVTITAAAKDSAGKTAAAEIQTRFYDVNDDSKYYYNPVYWAAENGVTMGYDRVYFGPQRTCTRRELAIFLWRIAGKPESSGNLPFKDTGSYAKTSDTFKAILWCYENGIVKGYDDNTFRPNNSIIRKDTMIMLYRLAGKPAVSGTMKFPDVIAQKYSANSDTYRSIIWGTENGITKGYADGSFKPLADCLREHIVTFIYRYDQNK